MEGMEEVATYVSDPSTGGGRHGDVNIYLKAFVQSILLSGSEIWLVTPCSNQKLGGFHKRLYIWLTTKYLTGRN